MSYQEAAPSRIRVGRPSKFTPEHIQQIKDLVARGETCEDIAAVIEVTVGTLKVTCSRLGVSLRRPKVKLLPPSTATETAKRAGTAAATFTIRMQYNGRAQDTPLPLTSNMISQLALEASARDQRIGELAKDLLEIVAERGLFDEVLGK
jgi:hypothetical protein